MMATSETDENENHVAENGAIVLEGDDADPNDPLSKTISRLYKRRKLMEIVDPKKEADRER